MILLLDTHTFLWAVTDDQRLSPRARKMMSDEQNELWLSIASIWELALKIDSGKLKVLAAGEKLSRFILTHAASLKVNTIPIELEHISAVPLLPKHHPDPFDRLLVAQAMHYSIPILTTDRQIARDAIRAIW